VEIGGKRVGDGERRHTDEHPGPRNH
jgi:hypothetical protein